MTLLLQIWDFLSQHHIKQWKLNKIRTFTNSGHAPMGWGLPAAIGAFYARRKK